MVGHCHRKDYHKDTAEPSICPRSSPAALLPHHGHAFCGGTKTKHLLQLRQKGRPASSVIPTVVAPDVGVTAQRTDPGTGLLIFPRISNGSAISRTFDAFVMLSDPLRHRSHRGVRFSVASANPLQQVSAGETGFALISLPGEVFCKSSTNAGHSA